MRNSHIIAFTTFFGIALGVFTSVKAYSQKEPPDTGVIRFSCTKPGAPDSFYNLSVNPDGSAQVATEELGTIDGKAKTYVNSEVANARFISNDKRTSLEIYTWKKTGIGELFFGGALNLSCKPN